MPVVLCENRTKYALDSALRQLLERKPLDQIRVRELTELCALRRQSFYYHFPDVYALFRWSLQQEREWLLERQKNFITWQQAMTDLLEHIMRHCSYYQALMANQGRAGLREVLDGTLAYLLEKTLDYYQQRCGETQMPEARQTQRECWETILLSLLEGWIQQDLAQPPEEIGALMETTIRQSAMGAAWRNLPRRNK